MERKENILGIKIIGTFIAIEHTDPFGDLSKYDFLYTDYISNSYNGNTTYSSKINPLSTSKKYFEINGWKLKDLTFPGNWFGECGKCTLEDRFGKSITIYGADQSSYSQNYMYMIRETISKALDFTLEYPCVEYKEFITGINPPTSNVTLEEFHRFIASVDGYISKYKELKEQLTEEEAEKYVTKMKESVSQNLRKCFNFDIVID